MSLRPLACALLALPWLTVPVAAHGEVPATPEATATAEVGTPPAPQATPQPAPSATPAPRPTPRAASPAEPPAPEAPPAATVPTWPHLTVQAGSATAWIQRDVEVGPDTTIRVAGTGWTTQDGRGSTVAVKLNRSATAQYTRSGDDVVDHPSAAGDTTIWVLVTAGSDGTFDETFDAPDGLVAGQYLSASLLSGRFDANDVKRSATSALMTVGGRPHTGDGGTQDDVTCVPTASTPTAQVEVVEDGVGGTVRLTGEGWCHPGTGRGGSKVGIKINEGAYSRTDTSVHQNVTIWAIVEADAATGRLDARLTLPSGETTGPTGSLPAFTEGSYTLRLLSGSLKAGDTTRTLLTDTFVVGTYRPTTSPDPLEYAEDLTPDTRGDLAARRSDDRLVVTLPDRPRTWVLLSTYRADGSPEYPWGGEWLRTDAAGRVSVPASSAPNARVKLVAQSGDRDDFGALLGWTWWGADPAPAPAPAPVPAPRATAPTPVKTLVSRTFSPVATTTDDQPTIAPAPPAMDAAGLGTRDPAGVRIALDGDIATVTVPAAPPGAWVHPYLYVDQDEPLAAGWIALDADRRLRLDLSALPDGPVSIALMGRDARLLGWGRTQRGGTTEAAAAPAPVTLPPRTTAVAASPLLGELDWWLLAAGGAIALGTVAGAVTTRRKVLA